MSLADLLSNFPPVDPVYVALEESRRRLHRFLEEPNKPEVREAFVIAAREGWYLGPSMAPNAIMRAAEEIQSGNSEAVDRGFTAHYEAEADALVEQLGQ
jgi:hypothetical protein